MKNELLPQLRQTLQENIDLKTLESSSKFFKEGERAQVYGVKTGIVNKIGKEFYEQVKSFSKSEIFEIAEELLRSNYMEEAFIAFILSEALEKQYEPSDFKIFEYWVNTYINNWATCDTLCNHTIGNFIMMFPEYIHELKKWARSENRWVKRASAVTLIIPARKGLFLKDVLEIADILLEDKDDMVQKGYGWMLKAASEAYQQEIYEYVLSQRSVMPRTSLRYAIEKMPKELKTEAMRKV
ncbi:DNA alkylation repair protein [Chryseobacterium sp.]|uniref:DNA alkylation repair protein n=1 Tax=Chryseobacterium sp. TaxID=1871047 RepID=UPI0025C0163E|nr:DNA alkylation repair protein [Chryseobacterium sp.]